MARHAARTQQQQFAAEQADDGGFKADAAGAPVQGCLGLCAGLVRGVGDGGGAGAARTVGGGGRQRPPEPAEHGLGHRMVRRPHRYAVQPGARQVTDGGRIDGRGDQGQGSGPEGFSQIQRAPVQGGDAPCGVDPGHMGDHRIEPRPPLGREHAGDSLRIGRVAGEAVHRFGGQDDQPAALKSLDRPADLGVVRAVFDGLAQALLRGGGPRGSGATML